MFGTQFFLPFLASLRDTSQHHRLLPRRLSAIRTIILAYLLIIVVGAGLLSLPLAQRPGDPVDVLNCLFTAISAMTLTGLVTVSTADSWSILGQVILLLLIQLGALVYMTVATVIALRLGLRLGLQTRLQLPSISHGFFSRHDLWRLLRYVATVTLLAEGLGMFLLALFFHQHPESTGTHPLFAGIFYAISAFCNAGFDLSPGFTGLTLPAYRSSLVLLALLGFLAMLGGLGVDVLAEIGVTFRRRRMSLHAKLVLVSTVILFFLGVGAFLLFESPHYRSSLNAPQLGAWLTNAGFLSISARSAGFSAVDLNSLSPPTLLMLSLLMFIGGAPASTAGGVKVITITVISLAIFTLLRRRQDIEVFHRRISGEMVRLALSLVFLSTFVILLFVLGISVIEITLKAAPQTPDTTSHFFRLAFEVLSAFGNVGFRSGLTATLEPASRILLMVAMLLGRLGPLLFIYIFAQAKRPVLRRLPTESVMAG